MKMRFFDFEVTPNYWLCVFGDLPNDWQENRPTEKLKDTFTYVDSDMPDCRDKLLALMTPEDVCNVGYNIKGYDLMIANGIYQGFAPNEIKIISDLIVNPKLAYSNKEYARLNSFAYKRMRGITYLDLMDSAIGSLKDKESTLLLSVLESSVPFDKTDLSTEDKQDLIYYCKHDVWSAMIWFMEIVNPFLNSKLALAHVFNLDERDAYKCTNAQLVAKVLSAERTDFPDAERQDIVLPERIREYINNNLPKEIVEYVCNNIKSKTVKLFDNIVVYADGGIHSTYDTKQERKTLDVLFAEEDTDYALLNLDVSSFYPAMMIILGTLSRSIKDKARFEFVYNDRVRIKHKPNKTEEDNKLQLAYKLILNTTYGASGCEHLALSDPYQRTRTCRYGQLLLTALANRLYTVIKSLSIVQTNTDGILVYVKRADVPIVERLRDEWSEMSGLSMDIESVQQIWQRDVNNYVLVKPNGKIKRKGLWLLNDRHRPGYISVSPLDCWCVGKAAIDFLRFGKNPIQSILSNTNIEDFCIYCKMGPTFDGVEQEVDGETHKLFKGNRVIATKDKKYGILRKYKIDADGIKHYTQMPNVPEHCMLVNDDLSTYNFADLKPKIDYMYYITRLYEKLVCTKDNKDIVYKQLAGDEIFITNQFDIEF